MADPEIFIVSRLNDCFGLDLTLVDFDEKAPLELLQLLLDVLADLDPRLRGDVRDAGTAESAGRAADLLRLLKYPPLRDRADADGYQKWVDAAAAGATTTVHPALHWLLGDVERHRTRAYVARFLAPVDVPPHLLDDAALREAFEHHRALQRDFRDAHRAVVASRAAAARGGPTLRAEARQLEAERAQLEAKVAALRRRGADVPDFDRLLAARGPCGWRRTRTRGSARRPRGSARPRGAPRPRGPCARRGSGACAPGSARRARRTSSSTSRGAASRRSSARPARRRRRGAPRRRRRRGARTRRSSSGAWATSRRASRLRARCRDGVGARGDATLRSFRATAQIVARRLAEKSAAVDGLEVDLGPRAARSRRAERARGGAGGRRRAGRAALRRAAADDARLQGQAGAAAGAARRARRRAPHRARAAGPRGRPGPVPGRARGGAGRAWLPGRARAPSRRPRAGRKRGDAAKAGELEAAAGRARAAAGAPRAQGRARAAHRGPARARAGPAAARGVRDQAPRVRRRRGGRRGRRAAPRARGGRAPGGRARRGVALPLPELPLRRRARGRRPRAPRTRAARRPPRPRGSCRTSRATPEHAHKGDRQRALVDQLRRRKAGLDRGAAPRRRQRARFEHLRALLAARLAARGARAPAAAAERHRHARVAQFA